MVIDFNNGQCIYTWRSLSSFSVTKELIWRTKLNMAIAKKNVGPIVLTAEIGLTPGCGNSFRNTFQLKLGSEFSSSHQLEPCFSNHPQKQKTKNKKITAIAYCNHGFKLCSATTNIAAMSWFSKALKLYCDHNCSRDRTLKTLTAIYLYPCWSTNNFYS